MQNVQQGLVQFANRNNMEFTFTLTEEEANIILMALQEVPAKLCNPLSNKLREQAQAQVAQQGKVPRDLHVDLASNVAPQESFA